MYLRLNPVSVRGVLADIFVELNLCYNLFDTKHKLCSIKLALIRLTKSKPPIITWLLCDIIAVMQGSSCKIFLINKDAFGCAVDQGPFSKSSGSSVSPLRKARSLRKPSSSPVSKLPWKCQISNKSDKNLPQKRQFDQAWSIALPDIKCRSSGQLNTWLCSLCTKIIP